MTSSSSSSSSSSTPNSSFPFKRPPPPPSRWLSAEFIFYLSKAVIFFSFIGITAFHRSEWVLERYGNNPSFKPGWLGGRKMDLSDLQWNEFRLKLPLLFVGASLFILCSNAVKQTFKSYKANLIFYWITSIGFLIYAHGSRSFWVVSIAVINYYIGKKFKQSRWNPTLTWIFNLSMLYLSYRYHGFPFRLFSSNLRFLDQWRGVLAWETYFKVSLCRLISFNMDYYFTLNNINHNNNNTNNNNYTHIDNENGKKFDDDYNQTSQHFHNPTLVHSKVSENSTASPHQGELERRVEEGRQNENIQENNNINNNHNHNNVTYQHHQSKNQNNDESKQKYWSDYRVRQETDLPIEHYNFTMYFAYLFYIPLYIAGPISSYNAFASQVIKPLNNYSWSYILQLFARWLATLLFLEIALHFNFYHAVNEYGYWRQADVRSWELGFMGLWVLTFMYMKFMIIWRFFRLWSLLDGIDVPPNMIRCVYNNYTFTGFWRSWHSSLNKWIVRYLYRPLGGSKTQIYSIWLIFTFIGLWHDLWWRWVAWAWLNCIFFSCEILIMKTFFFSKTGQRLYIQPYFRHILALCGACNILLLMAANLAILHGFKGTYLFFRKFLLNSQAIYAIPLWLWLLWSGVQLMIEIRNEERRRNIYKNC